MLKTNTKYYKKCKICDSTDLNDLYNINKFTISKCLECDFIFVKNILSEKQLDLYYSDEQSNDPDDPIYADEINQDNLNYYYKKLLYLLSKLKFNNGNLLDIGCNRGQFLNLAKDKFDVYGIERAKAAYLIAQRNFGKKIFTGTLKDYPLKKEFFNVITLMDVFDHLINPITELKKIEQMLVPGGVVIIKIHNIDCLLSKITGKNFYAILPPFHLSYFSPSNIKSLLLSLGYENVNIKFIGNKLSFKTIFYRLARRKKTGLFYFLFRVFSLPVLRNLFIIKNLRDIMTITAYKK